MIALLLSAAALASDPPVTWVTGGEPAPSGVWNDVAAVGFSWGVGCTGTLIAPDLVLTAGHCAYGIKWVIVGTNDYEVGGERINAVRVTEYPDSQRTYDVAIVELERPATVSPRPLALDCTIDQDLYDGADVAIVGYGATDEDASRYSSHLNQAFTVVTDHDCSATNRGCYSRVQPDGELIAGGEGIDSCNGDSGGPLYLRSGDAWVLVGVTSRAAYPTDTYCGDGGIYVRVDAIADWIEDTTGRELPRPDCGDEPVNRAPAPSAEPIVVEAGEAATTRVLANDPDAGDLHTFAVIDPPRGAVEIAPDGTVTYTAGEDDEGGDDFVVIVTDDGSPPRAAEVLVAVDVLPGEEPEPVDTDDAIDDDTPDLTLRAAGGCGCATGGVPGAWTALLGLVALLRRRRAAP